MTDSEVRLACLKLAMELVPDGGAGREEQVLALAARLYEFTRG